MKKLSVCAAVLGAIALALGGLSATVALAEPIDTSGLGGAPDATQQYQEVKDAVTRFRNGDIDGAKALLVTAAKKYADLPPAEVMLAQLFAAANQGNQVVAWLEEAIKQTPGDPEAYLILGDLAFRGGRVTEAGLMFGKANALLPEFKGAAKRKKALVERISAGLASVAEVAQDWAGAQKHIEAWLAEEPNNANALQRLGRALFQQNKATEALEKFKAAKKASEQVLTPEAILAQLYEAAGDRENAAKMMVAALKAAPNDVPTRLAAAQWSFETEQYDQAKEQAAIAMKLDPDSLGAKILAGIVALFLKDNKAAEGFFEAAHLQSPANFAASNNLALALAEQDNEAKKRKALEYADVNVRANQNAAEAWSTYGWVLYRLNRLNEAEQALAKAASAGTLSADTAFYIAKVQADRGQNAKAKELLENALKTKRPFSMRKEAEALLEKLK